MQNQTNSILDNDGNGQNITLKTYSLSCPVIYW